MKVYLVGHTCQMQVEYPICVAKNKKIAKREFEKWEKKKGGKEVTKAWGWKIYITPIEFKEK